ncbi:hypothetical protein [Streptomyces sp. NPDC001508]|uniref:hypothetical protein n=1 Tax=Streptomyces sp. NPDC001508 TaxID=3154656 RepID=UPI00332B90B7
MTTSPTPNLLPRPRAATAAGMAGMIYGIVLAGASGFGMLALILWAADARPGENRMLGAVLGGFILVLLIAAGWAIARNGRALLLFRSPRSAEGIRALTGTFSGLCALALCNGAFDTDTPAAEWWKRMAGYGAMLAASLTVTLLCGRRDVRVWLGTYQPPRPTPPPPSADTGHGRRAWKSAVASSLIGLLLGGAIIVMNIGGEKEVLVFGGGVVRPRDTCYEIGGQGRTGDCADIATREKRHVPTDTGSVISGALIIAVGGLISAVALMPDRRRTAAPQRPSGR